MFWRRHNKFKWASEFFAPSPLLRVRSWLHSFKGHYEQKSNARRGCYLRCWMYETPRVYPPSKWRILRQVGVSSTHSFTHLPPKHVLIKSKWWNSGFISTVPPCRPRALPPSPGAVSPQTQPCQRVLSRRWFSAGDPAPAACKHPAEFSARLTSSPPTTHGYKVSA